MRVAFALIAAAATTAAFATLPMPAAAQDADFAPAQRTVAASAGDISQGAYRDAELRLSSELRKHPDLPELMLNLAAVYGRTGRASEAQALYARVLGQDDVLMDLSNGRTASAHAIAKLGLGQLNAVQFSAK